MAAASTPRPRVPRGRRIKSDGKLAGKLEGQGASPGGGSERERAGGTPAQYHVANLLSKPRHASRSAANSVQLRRPAETKRGGRAGEKRETGIAALPLPLHEAGGPNVCTEDEYEEKVGGMRAGAPRENAPRGNALEEPRRSGPQRAGELGYPWHRGLKGPENSNTQGLGARAKPEKEWQHQEQCQCPLPRYREREEV